jgi:hypothetical protein
MEALEAQRFLQTTLPRFLDKVDDSYKVPVNFKVPPTTTTRESASANWPCLLCWLHWLAG